MDASYPFLDQHGLGPISGQFQLRMTSSHWGVEDLGAVAADLANAGSKTLLVTTDLGAFCSHGFRRVMLTADAHRNLLLVPRENLPCIEPSRLEVRSVAELAYRSTHHLHQILTAVVEMTVPLGAPPKALLIDDAQCLLREPKAALILRRIVEGNLLGACALLNRYDLYRPLQLSEAAAAPVAVVASANFGSWLDHPAKAGYDRLIERLNPDSAVEVKIDTGATAFEDGATGRILVRRAPENYTGPATFAVTVRAGTGWPRLVAA